MDFRGLIPYRLLYCSPMLVACIAFSTWLWWLLGIHPFCSSESIFVCCNHRWLCCLAFNIRVTISGAPALLRNVALKLFLCVLFGLIIHNAGRLEFLGFFILCLKFTFLGVETENISGSSVDDTFFKSNARLDVMRAHLA